MLVTTHFLTGAAIASVSHDPLVFIPVAFASHFVLDTIPHSQSAYKPWVVTNKVVVMEVFDVTLAVAIVLFLTCDLGLSNNLWLGAIAGSLPDVDGLFYVKPLRNFLKKPLIKTWAKFHESIQNETPQFLGKATQFVAITVSLWAILVRV